ncbi:MAG TPA: hypothetical protein GXZ35_08385 [Acholeplasmataceae bacterium]|nr:hypothetical protein [Acholeplasmataceae bacterium]
MSTPYHVVDNSFLSKITDDFLLSIPDEDLQKLIDGYRNSASIKFKQCNKLSDRDDDLRQYNISLTDEEIEILANLMILEWLKPLINSIEILKQGMSTKDYKIYSQANHLNELMALKKETNAEIDKLIISYTYSNNSLDDLGKV